MTRFQFRLTIDYGDPEDEKGDAFGSTDGSVGTAVLLRKLADRLDEGGEGPYSVPTEEGITLTADYTYADADA